MSNHIIDKYCMHTKKIHQKNSMIESSYCLLQLINETSSEWPVSAITLRNDLSRLSFSAVILQFLFFYFDVVYMYESIIYRYIFIYWLKNKQLSYGYIFQPPIYHILRYMYPLCSHPSALQALQALQFYIYAICMHRYLRYDTVHSDSR